MKTIDELLPEKYKGATHGEWTLEEDEMAPSGYGLAFKNSGHLVSGPERFNDEANDYNLSVRFDRLADAKLFLDSRKNAVLASLLPAAVKLLNDYIPIIEGEWGDGSASDIEELLQRISEATKAVEGKR